MGRSKKKPPMKAWLITRGPGLLAALKGAIIVDILSARNSVENIREYIQRLHDRCCLTLWERAEGARYNRKDEPVYKAEVNVHALPNAQKIGTVIPRDPSRSPQIH